MNRLICPISSEKISKSVVRTTGFLVAATIILYALTSNIFFMVLLLVDFTLRGFTSTKLSPYSLSANKISQTLKFKTQFIDKAPKIFASRVGFIFALASVLLYFSSPTISLVIALILLAFSILESLFDLCVGTVVYNYIILPLNKNNK